MSKLKDIDRDNGRDIEVTVNGITITITDFKPLPPSEIPTPPINNDIEDYGGHQNEEDSSSPMSHQNTAASALLERTNKKIKLEEES